MHSTTKGCPLILTGNYGLNIVYLKLLWAQKRNGGYVSIRVSSGNLIHLIHSGKYQILFDTINVNQDRNPLIGAIVEMFTWWKLYEIPSEVTLF